MRHRKSGRKLGMDSSARKAMWRNMVTSLMLHGRIRTTEHRAKELRRYADRVITMGKRAPTKDALSGLSGDDLQRAKANRVSAIRRARRWINNDVAIDRVFSEYAERFRTRSGGYTRVVKAGRRGGDNASMAIIELVETLEDAPPPKVEAQPEPETAPAAPDLDPADFDEEPTVAIMGEEVSSEGEAVLEDPMSDEADTSEE
jgi:large subunit ribosomal protein L17